MHVLVVDSSGLFGDDLLSSIRRASHRTFGLKLFMSSTLYIALKFQIHIF